MKITEEQLRAIIRERLLMEYNPLAAILFGTAKSGKELERNLSQAVIAPVSDSEANIINLFKILGKELPKTGENLVDLRDEFTAAVKAESLDAVIGLGERLANTFLKDELALNPDEFFEYIRKHVPTPTQSRKISIYASDVFDIYLLYTTNEKIQLVISVTFKYASSLPATSIPIMFDIFDLVDHYLTESGYNDFKNEIVNQLSSTVKTADLFGGKDVDSKIIIDEIRNLEHQLMI